MKGKKKSNGNFMDFIADFSGDPKLQKKFLTDIYGKGGGTAEGILNIFHSLNYDGVSLDDCSKFLIVIKAGPLPCTFKDKY